MVSDYDLLVLSEIRNVVGDRYGENYVDIRPLAKKFRLDIDEVMKEIVRICEEKDYNVGNHMDCTRKNVIPEYEESGKLMLNRDHIEGLSRILMVDKGYIKDF